MFGRLFGTNQAKQKTTKKANLNDSIQDLRKAVGQLDKREVHLEKRIQDCLTKAKAKSKKRDKKGALFELKKKKQLESQLQSIQGKKLNLETQIMALEDAHMNKEVLKVMKKGADAIKGTINDADLEKAEDVVEDMQEAMDLQNEMSEAISQPLGMPMDDDELEAELAELEEMEADELLQGLQEAPQQQQNLDANIEDMPNVPSGKIKKKQEQEEEDELNELAMMMDD